MSNDAELHTQTNWDMLAEKMWLNKHIWATRDEKVKQRDKPFRKEICKLKLQINDHLNMKHINPNQRQTKRGTMWVCECVAASLCAPSEMAAKDIALIGHIRWVRHMSRDSMHDNAVWFGSQQVYMNALILTLKVWICGHHWINSYKLPMKLHDGDDAYMLRLSLCWAR